RGLSGSRQFRRSAGRAKGSRSAAAVDADGAEAVGSLAAATRRARVAAPAELCGCADVARGVWRRARDGRVVEGNQGGAAAATGASARSRTAQARARTRPGPSARGPA